MTQQSDHPEDQATADKPDEQLGIRTYTTTSPILVKAVQLTEGADWDAIAAWCGGQVDVPDVHRSALVIPGIATAVLDDWVIRGVTGSFFVRSPEEFAATYTPVFNRPSNGWAHDNGTVCDAGFLADRSYPEPGKLWWCTEHQRHLIPDLVDAKRTEELQERYDDLEAQFIDLFVPVAKLLGVPAAVDDPERTEGDEAPEDMPKVWNLDGVYEALGAVGAPSGMVLRPTEQDSARLLNAMETAPATLRATLPMAEWIRYGLTKLADRKPASQCDGAGLVERTGGAE